MEMYLGRLALAYRAAMAVRISADPELAEWGLRPPAMGTLRVIDRCGPISQREVCERVGVHPSDMVGIVDLLERHGLLTRERSGSDRRRYELTLTSSARSVLDRFATIARAVDEEFYARLSLTERKQLERLLAKLVDAHTAGRGPGPTVAAPDRIADNSPA